MIEPFEGYLVTEDVASRVVAKPFDQLGRPERHALARADELSFLNVIDHPSGDVRQGARHLEGMIDSGVFSHQPNAYYAYRVTHLGHSAIGLVGAMPVSVFSEDRIRGHEAVNDEDVEALRSFFDIAGAQSSPIALTCAEPFSLESILDLDRPPTLSIATDGYRASVWAIDSEPGMTRIEEMIARCGIMYITDGHHRAAALSRRESRALVMLVSPHELSVLPFQRIVRNGAPLWDRIGDMLATETPEKSGPAVVQRGRRRELSLPNGGSDLIDSLDVVRLHRDVLEPLGIAPDDDRLEYVAIPAQEIEQHMGPDDLGFTLAPVPVDTVLAAADAGLLMPPKTTYFAPKAGSGVFVMRM